ncbi:ABC transporter transmembrane subunit [Enterococcus faecalis]|nr:ABC transporter transmembrane subunit [Enterococcus faecalis]
MSVQQSMRDLRRDIEEKINRLPVSYFDKNQQGNILSRVTNDVDAVSNAMQQSFINIVSAVLGIVMAVVMMFLINPLDGDFFSDYDSVVSDYFQNNC